jgi:metallo-beta-lactamase family protein
VLFSGDVGRYDAALHVDPKPRPESDALVIESTYGNRKHPDVSVEEQIAGPLNETFRRRGVVLVPAFAVGRSQLVTLVLRRLMKKGVIPEVPIHIDSPMAVNATEIYSKYLDDGNLDHDVFEDGRDELFPHNVALHRSVEESKELNGMDGPRVIISSSGMMVGGRILHHLRRRLPDSMNLVCLVGYQAEGTRGRAILEGRKTLRMHGRDVPVNARILVLNGLSGHADSDELLRWYRSCPSVPRRIFVTHGEPEPARALAERLAGVGATDIRIPELDETLDL